MLLLFRLLAEKVSLLGLDYCYIVVQLVSSRMSSPPKEIQSVWQSFGCFSDGLSDWHCLPLNHSCKCG